VGSEVVVFVSSDGAKASSEEGRTEGKGRPEQLHLSNKEITVHLIKKSANQGRAGAPTGLHLAPPVFVRDGGDIMSTVGSEVVVFVKNIFLSQYNDT
jgi:hypothetical protein